MSSASRTRVTAPIACLLVASSFGCGEPVTSVDAGRPLDAALTADASTQADASLEPDASLELDASFEPDASYAPDVGPATDAFVPSDVASARCGVDAGEAPTFRALYADVIAPYRCAECHRAGELWSMLDLSSVEVAYTSLVGVVGCDGVTPRVTPCDPRASTLGLVPTGRAEPCGGRHTYSGVYPTGIVTPEERERIDAWIAAGAAY